jgi:hypothetical protein
MTRPAGPAPRRTGLPSPSQWAPGYLPCPHSPFAPANYATARLATPCHPARRLYENVARRRTTAATASAAPAPSIDDTIADLLTALVGMCAPPPPPPQPQPQPPPVPAVRAGSPPAAGLLGRAPAGMLAGRTSPAPAAASAAQQQQQPLLGRQTSVPAGFASAAQQTPANPPPLLPLEDPELVGEAAARRAREQRQYRESVLAGYDDGGWKFWVAEVEGWGPR